MITTDVQLVGRNCETCKGRIVSDIEALWCPPCDRAFHEACLRGKDRCPSCGQAFQEALDALRAQASGRARSELLKGRRLLLLCIMAFVVSRLVLIVVALSTGGELEFGRALQSLPVLVLLSGFLYLGYGWARRWLQLVLVAAVVANVFVFVQMPEDEAVPMAMAVPILALFVFADGWVFYMVSWNRNVRRFLESQKP